MENKAKRKYSYILSLAILIIIFALMYKSGYRITSNFHIGKMGYLKIHLPAEQISLIIDKKTKINSTENLTTVVLSPKIHEIIVSKEGYYPWIKKVKIPSGQTSDINPFFVSQNASGQIINMTDPNYWTIKRTVQTAELPTKEKPLVSKDGNFSVWVENNAVIMKNGDSIHTIVEPDTIIKNLSFYKNRGDVLIFSTYNGIYAIETDTSDTQNFMPIYKGASPYFATSTENSIYILDRDLLMEVVI